MTRRHPPVVREAIAAIAEHGHAADVDLAGSGHFKISWEAGSRRPLFVLSRSPSDRRCAANARAVLRRLLAQGAQP